MKFRNDRQEMEWKDTIFFGDDVPETDRLMRCCNAIRYMMYDVTCLYKTSYRRVEPCISEHQKRLAYLTTKREA